MYELKDLMGTNGSEATQDETRDEKEEDVPETGSSFSSEHTI